MDNLSIVIVSFIIVVLCITLLNNTSVENFRTTSRPLLKPMKPYKFYKTKWDDIDNLIWFNSWGYTQRPYRYCTHCKNKLSKKCAECTTCGWCKPLGYAGRCEAGNEFGPYYARDCYQWYYGGKSSGLY